jgi:peptidyl-prolyl cis-trans isomerase A (cyclophilin A)
MNYVEIISMARLSLGLIAASVFLFTGTTFAQDTKTAKPVVPSDKKEEKAPVKTATGTTIELETSEGKIRIALDTEKAPVTTKNFLDYVNSKFYDGTVFHRVIDGFMVQGGGFNIEGGQLKEKKTNPSITNEGKNGLKNDRGTIAMARTRDPNSATAQFFINHVDNNSLNHPNPDGHGYAVFGKVVEGMDVVDKIAKAKTGMKYGMSDVPETEVKIISAKVVK